MAAGRIVLSQYFPARDRNGRLVAGARLFVYSDGTTTKAPIYSNESLTTPLANPVVANSSGQFPSIWATDDLEYTLSITGPDGESIGNPSVFDGFSVSVDAVSASVALAEAAAASAEANYQDALAIEAMGSSSAAIATRAAKNANLSDLADAAAARSNIGADLAANVNLPALDGSLQQTLDQILRRTPSPFLYGVVGNGSTDDTAGWQAWIDHCLGSDLPLVCTTPMVSRITDTLTFTIPATAYPSLGVMGAPLIDLRAVVYRYAGTRDRPVLLFDAFASDARYGEIHLPSVYVWEGSVTWPGALNGNDVATRLRGLSFYQIHEGHTYGFTTGIQHLGSNYCSVFGRHIEDCKYGRVWTTEGLDPDASFVNQNSVFGGRIGHTSNALSAGTAYGDVFTWDKVGSYRGVNNNNFTDVAYEMGGSSSPATYRVPVWFDGVGAANTWRGARHEFNKGPFAILNAGGGPYAHQNEFNVTFNQSGGAVQGNYILEVNGAAGNIMTGSGCATHYWSSGPLRSQVSSAGTSGLAYFHGVDLFHTEVPATALRTTTGSTDVLAHRDALVMSSNRGVAVQVDTSRIKTLRLTYASHDSFPGRPRLFAFDAAGASLSGDATDATWGNEPYVKAAYAGTSSVTLGASGVAYSTPADDTNNRDMWITVRDEVKTLWISIGGGSSPAVLYNVELFGYSSRNKIGGNSTTSDGVGALPVINPLGDTGGQPLAAANPGTAGNTGYYARGQRIGSTASASAATPGWVCTTTGWLAPVWTASTAYAITGLLVTNDTGKIYELVTAGTSAGSGGPTGTGTSISDGTAVWKYIGVKAAFVAEANLP